MEIMLCVQQRYVCGCVLLAASPLSLSCYQSSSHHLPDFVGASADALFHSWQWLIQTTDIVKRGCRKAILELKHFCASGGGGLHAPEAEKL